mmetsp:Transcript_111448/g.326005  ORF Transcript_111448/g.326005 Transcript_111448/m.326005 type:complete len:407 (+) Transcript_111448:81-1301(+)
MADRAGRCSLSGPGTVRRADSFTRPNTTSALFKTQMCKSWLIDLCTQGDFCKFAHGNAELRGRPDWSRTGLCRRWLKKGVCRDSTCPYAHSVEELRTVGTAHSSVESLVEGILALTSVARRTEPPKCRVLSLLDSEVSASSSSVSPPAGISHDVATPPADVSYGLAASAAADSSRTMVPPTSTSGGAAIPPASTSGGLVALPPSIFWSTKAHPAESADASPNAVAHLACPADCGAMPPSSTFSGTTESLGSASHGTAAPHASATLSTAAHPAGTPHAAPAPSISDSPITLAHPADATPGPPTPSVGASQSNAAHQSGIAHSALTPFISDSPSTAAHHAGTSHGAPALSISFSPDIRTSAPPAGTARPASTMGRSYGSYAMSNSVCITISIVTAGHARGHRGQRPQH